MAKLKDMREARGALTNEAIEPLLVLRVPGERRRKLIENRAEVVAQLAGASEDPVDRSGLYGQALDVRYVAASLTAYPTPAGTVARQSCQEASVGSR